METAFAQPPLRRGIFLATRIHLCPEQTNMGTTWRIQPDHATDYQVEQLARRESRSRSNMLLVLVREALAARRNEAAVSHLAPVIAGNAPAANN
jgi:hypothetical protein